MSYVTSAVGIHVLALLSHLVPRPQHILPVISESLPEQIGMGGNDKSPLIEPVPSRLLSPVGYHHGQINLSKFILSLYHIITNPMTNLKIPITNKDNIKVLTIMGLMGK